MIRCESLREIGGYDEMFSCQDGYDLWIRFIEDFKVQNINLPYFTEHGFGSIEKLRTDLILGHNNSKPMIVNQTAVYTSTLSDPALIVIVFP